MTNQGNSTQNQYVCQPCSSGCGSCSGPSLYQCLTCSSTSYMTASGVCVSICPNGTYPNNAMQSCSSCPYGCSQCLNSMNCTACISNYTLTSTNQCKSNSICSVANCQFCSATALNTCSQCLPSYYIYNSSCFSACPASTYAQNGQCIPCPANCIACTATGCTACSSLTYLYQGICVASCPVGTYLSAGYCQSDPCLAYNSATNGCLQCVTPYLLYSNRVTAPNGSVGVTTVCVLNCPSGTIQSGSTCVSCSPNCLSCISPTICAVCTAGTFLY
jgi:proprotein convertase subtilisin/kexin type 5